jgi:hypothetical protein
LRRALDERQIVGMPTGTEPLFPSPLLAQAEAQKFAEDGWLGPFDALNAATAGRIISHLDAHVLSRSGPDGGSPDRSRYLDDPVTSALAAHPAIIARVRCLLGDDLMLWRSRYWDKRPGGLAVGWHQDGADWPITPMINVTAWLALTHSSSLNGGLELLPGTNKRYLPHDRSPNPDLMFNNRVLDAHLSETRQAIVPTIEPGQFVLFDEGILHRSARNDSTVRRLALALRITLPSVQVQHDRIFVGHRCMTLRGSPALHNALQVPLHVEGELERFHS